MTKDNKAKVSNILLARRNILEYLKRLEISRDFDYEDIEKIGDYFLRYEELVIPILIEEMEKKQSEQVLNKYEYLIKYLDNYNLIKPLIKCLIRNKDNLKLRKTIIKVLKYYQVSFSDPPLDHFYSELTSEIEGIKTNLITTFSNDWKSFIEFYTDFLYLDDGQVDIIKSIEKNKDEKKFGVFLSMLLTNNDLVIKSVIEALGRIDDLRSLNTLRRALVFLPIRYHNLIEINIRKLNFKGIRDEGEVLEENNIISTYLGYPFSNGIRHLLYLLRERDHYKILLIEMDERIGITENCFFYDGLNEDKKQNILSRLIDQFYLREVFNNYDLKILNNGIFYSYASDSRFPAIFSIFINFLPSYYFKPVLYSSDKIRDKFKVMFNKESLLDRSERLWDIVDVLGWLSEDDRFIAIIERWYKNTKKEEHFWMDELIIKKVLREIILSDINIWKERLLFLADFLDNIKENQTYIDIILAVESEFVKDIEKMEKIPFIKKLILESKKLVLMTM